MRSCWDRSVHLPVCPSVCLVYDWLSTMPYFCLFLHLCTRPSYLSLLLSVCVFPGVPETFISSSGVPVTPRGCVITGTARPLGHPSRFIISQCQRGRRGNSPDQWAEVEARLNFLSKSMCVFACRWTRWCVLLISLLLVILTDFDSSVL